jgi:hypothetical protein
MSVELIACVGLMWLLRFGSILRRPRDFLKKKSPLITELLSCSLCTGFWTGLIIGLVLYFLKDNSIVYFLFPFASSGLCWFFDSLLDLIQNALTNATNTGKRLEEELRLTKLYRETAESRPGRPPTPPGRPCCGKDENK